MRNTGKQIPIHWTTLRLKIKDSKLDDVDELQRIHDIVPQTRSWMQIEGRDAADCSMLSALEEGVLPPIPSRSKENFRLQSTRLINSDELIGFLAVYHGFPQEDIFWINALAFHPDHQDKGYGLELVIELFKIIKQMGGYGKIKSYASLTNWPSLRMCVKAGFNRMVQIVGDKVHTEKAEAHVLLEKVIQVI